MSRPAGYSSEEEDDDDGLSFSVDIKSARPSRDPPLNGNTPKEEKIIVAIFEKNLEEVKRIVSSGFNIDNKSSKYKNWTALMHACYEGNFEIIKYLLENKASVQEHHELVTPLLCLCDSKSDNEDELLKCLDILIDYGADVNAVDWFRTTALIYALKRNHEKLFLKLISLGCDINRADSEGWTPVFHAVKNGNLALVKVLKDSGADLKKLDQRGVSLLDIAMENDCKEIEELLNVSRNTFSNALVHFKKDGMGDFDFVLSELPNRSLGRHNGYQSDAIQWLLGVGLDSVVQSLLESNIQLNEILTADDDKLKKLGVMIDFDRKKIKYCVQKFHEHNWGKNSLNIPSNDTPLDLFRAANVFLAVLHHLHICSAASFFWKKYRNNQIPQKENEYIRKSIKFIRLIEKEKNALYKIVKEVEENNKIVPPDLILPKQKNYYSKCMLALAIVFGASLLKICIPITPISLMFVKNPLFKFR